MFTNRRTGHVLRLSFIVSVLEAEKMANEEIPTADPDMDGIDSIYFAEPSTSSGVGKRKRTFRGRGFRKKLKTG